MNALVTIVVSAGGATERMLRTCLCSLERHKGKTDAKVMVTAPKHQAGVPASVCDDMKVPCCYFEVDTDNLSGSRVHAAVLDRMVPHVDTPYLLTLDADCFPVADDWLDCLMDDIGHGASVSGILHPFAPPPSDLERHTIEYRIRSQLCSDNTHVACQLVGLDTLKRLKVGFSDGDDTGLAIPVQARKAGMEVTGLKLTCCASIDEEDLNDAMGVWTHGLERNRESCLIFGDKVYHHGGGCREAQGKGSPDDVWRGVRKRVLEEGGAEWLLEKGNVYRYKFDHEEEIADAMADSIMRGMKIYLETHDRVFGE